MAFYLDGIQIMKKLDRMDWKTEDAITLFREWYKEVGQSLPPCDAMMEALGYTDYDPEDLSMLSFELQVNEILNKNELN